MAAIAEGAQGCSVPGKPGKLGGIGRGVADFYGGYEIGKHVVNPAINWVISKLTGGKESNLGGALFDWLHPNAIQVNRQRAESRTLFPRLESDYHLPPGLLNAVWAQESSRGKSMVSAAGALGDFQFMPAVAAAYGVANPGSLRQSALGASKMYRDLLNQYGGDTEKALAAYNWGSGNLNHAIHRYGAGWLTHAPAETQNYVRDVMARMHAEPQRVEVHVRVSGAPAGTRVEARDSNGREIPARIGYSHVGAHA